MTIERDKFLTEVMGGCFHEWKWIPGGGWQCKNCDIDLYGEGNHTYTQKIPKTENPDFSTWPGFGLLWEWSDKQEWRNEFMSQPFSMREFINPDRFATAVYEYLKEQGR